MRSAIALSATVACAAVRSAGAFARPPAPRIARPAVPPRRTPPDVRGAAPPPSLQLAADDTTTPPEKSPMRRRLRTAAILAWERTDTLGAAGLRDDGAAPLHAGFKSGVGWFAAAILFKWYRARFVTKIPIWDRQPQWNMVVTSPEHEKELHAWRCKKCGSTIFIARHRAWFFKGGNTECTVPDCDAKGEENFEDIRQDLLDSIDDDYFDYESPLDFVSAAERRKLVKQAGGDEELAKKIAIDNVMKNDATQVQAEAKGGKTEEAPPPSPSSENGQRETKKKTPQKEKEPEDLFAELDMDL